MTVFCYKTCHMSSEQLHLLYCVLSLQYYCYITDNDMRCCHFLPAAVSIVMLTLSTLLISSLPAAPSHAVTYGCLIDALYSTLGGSRRSRKKQTVYADANVVGLWPLV